MFDIAITPRTRLYGMLCDYGDQRIRWYYQALYMAVGGSWCVGLYIHAFGVQH